MGGLVYVCVGELCLSIGYVCVGVVEHMCTCEMYIQLPAASKAK